MTYRDHSRPNANLQSGAIAGGFPNPDAHNTNLGTQPFIRPEVLLRGQPSPQPPEYLLAKPGIEGTLAERGKTNGNYEDTAAYTQSLKGTLHTSKNWSSLSLPQRESLEMIVHKIGRILSGDPNHKDHWHDIIGYAKLIEDSLA